MRGVNTIEAFRYTIAEEEYDTFFASLHGSGSLRTFSLNQQVHVERFFLGGGDRPHNFGNLPTFCVGFLHKKLEVFQK